MKKVHPLLLLAGGFLVVWAFLAVLARFIRIAPDWPVWAVARHVNARLRSCVIVGLGRMGRLPLFSSCLQK